MRIILKEELKNDINDNLIIDVGLIDGIRSIRSRNCGGSRMYRVRRCHSMYSIIGMVNQKNHL